MGIAQVPVEFAEQTRLELGSLLLAGVPVVLRNNP